MVQYAGSGICWGSWNISPPDKGRLLYIRLLNIVPQVTDDALSFFMFVFCFVFSFCVSFFIILSSSLMIFSFALNFC